MINKISIIIPVLNEEAALPLLIDEIKEAFNESNIEFEIVIVDDGSEIKVIDYIKKENNIKILENEYSMGQSFSIFKGIKNSTYDYVCTIDGDGQNPPSEIINLCNEFNNSNPKIDIIVGIRRKRKDSLFRSLYSKLGNLFIRWVTKTSSIDLGCSLKIFNKKIVKEINFKGDIHRIIIPLLEYRNYRIKQVFVEHRKRASGETKYGVGRIVAVLIDSILLRITNGFTRSARYSLGRFSLFFGFISLALFIISLIQKYNYEVFVHKNPIFIIGVATLFISLQLITIAVISFFLEEKN